MHDLAMGKGHFHRTGRKRNENRFPAIYASTTLNLASVSNLWTPCASCIRYSTIVHSIGTPYIPKMAPGHRDYVVHSDSMARELLSLTGILISSGWKRSKGTHKARAPVQLEKTETTLSVRAEDTLPRFVRDSLGHFA